ncbi:MAG TPA: hypothetical protein VJ891_03970 [Casimicrobiaceae bacterium]|nr:hypothetical protein [Casimicrobiaceae bacterium]
MSFTAKPDSTRSRRYAARAVKLGSRRGYWERARIVYNVVLGAIVLPRTASLDGEPLQHFTAIGIVTTAEACQVEMASGFMPYRADVRFLKQAKEVAIKPLIERLSFITNKKLKMPAADFLAIASPIGVKSTFQRDSF